MYVYISVKMPGFMSYKTLHILMGLDAWELITVKDLTACFSLGIVHTQLGLPDVSVLLPAHV